MATNLASMMMNDFRGDTLNRIASALGETTAKTQSALSGVIPAIVGGLARKASTNEGASQVLDVIHENRLDSEQFSSIPAAVSSSNGISNLMNMGRPLLSSVFGGRLNTLTDWVSGMSGMKSASSSSLMSMALPMALGFIGRRAGGSPRSLMDLMGEQREFINEAPAGLTGALGVTEGERPYVGTYEHQEHARPVVGTYQSETPRAAETARPVETSRPMVRRYEPERRGSSWWIWPLILIPLIALLWWAFGRRAAHVAQRIPEAASQTANKAIEAIPHPNLGEFVRKTLPGGTELNIPSNGVESKLLGFIQDPNQSVDKDTWFTMDRLDFDTGSAQLRPTSNEQLQNIANIMKAYPNVHLKIGGYTDNVGDEAVNMKLSQERAANTMNAIAALGIDRSRLSAEGFGKQFPVADNATEEGRQRNRRIDVRVTQK